VRDSETALIDGRPDADFEELAGTATLLEASIERNGQAHTTRVEGSDVGQKSSLGTRQCLVCWQLRQSGSNGVHTLDDL